jgi:hypothetical protein
MKYIWEDLPERLNCFTVKNTEMINLNTGKPVRHYSTNTKINLVQKCVTPEKTYYRTADAEQNYLNYAFEAEAFGLPNEKAPSVPSPHSSIKHSISNPAPRTPKPVKKQTSRPKVASSKGGESKQQSNWFTKLIRRFHGKTKNS